jgi:hypothetical protein
MFVVQASSLQFLGNNAGWKPAPQNNHSLSAGTALEREALPSLFEGVAMVSEHSRFSDRRQLRFITWNIVAWLHRTKLTGAAILVSRGTKILQAVRQFFMAAIESPCLVQPDAESPALGLAQPSAFACLPSIGQ